MKTMTEIEKLEQAYYAALTQLNDCEKAWRAAEDNGAVPGDAEYEACSQAHRAAGHDFDRARHELEAGKAGAYASRLAMNAALEDADRNRCPFENAG